MDFLEYSDVTAEIKGLMTPGKLKMTDQNIIFKNSKTGKVEQVQASDMDIVNFQNFVGSWGLRIFLKNGTLHCYGGFKDSEKEKIAKYFSTTYKMDMLEKELSLKGWNWGTAKFNGSVLSFDVGGNSAFEIPLNHVSQCITGKNEITMEFHQNDDTPVSLMEMRFFIPSNELAGDTDPVEAFQQQVMKKASVISVSGDAIAIFREIQCLTPRGRYDIKIFQSFFQLHGKTFDYKIPISTVLRLFRLPHKDSRQQFFVISLDPPIKQGQTRYHFLVLLFGQEEETSIELPFTDASVESSSSSDDDSVSSKSSGTLAEDEQEKLVDFRLQLLEKAEIEKSKFEASRNLCGSTSKHIAPVNSNRSDLPVVPKDSVSKNTRSKLRNQERVIVESEQERLNNQNIHCTVNELGGRNSVEGCSRQLTLHEHNMDTRKQSRNEVDTDDLKCERSKLKASCKSETLKDTRVTPGMVSDIPSTSAQEIAVSITYYTG